ncbi:hypothetical protein JHK85_045607 [Glycine max]|nr:hypothetical protein JHK86_045039 [Glycine max]KAG4951740.1 hypothetical protein JHK85_045607 [Glycine max]
MRKIKDKNEVFNRIALDETHISTLVSLEDRPRYRNKKCDVSTNVSAACGPDLRFIYELPRWEGSNGDSRVLRDALHRQNKLEIPTEDASASIDLEELGSGSKIRGQSSSSTSVQSQRRKIGEKDGIVALMKLVAESFDRLTQAYDKKVEENDIQEV